MRPYSQIDRDSNGDENEGKGKRKKHPVKFRRSGSHFAEQECTNSSEETMNIPYVGVFLYNSRGKARWLFCYVGKPHRRRFACLTFHRPESCRLSCKRWFSTIHNVTHPNVRCRKAPCLTPKKKNERRSIRGKKFWFIALTMRYEYKSSDGIVRKKETSCRFILSNRI